MNQVRQSEQTQSKQNNQRTQREKKYKNMTGLRPVSRLFQGLGYCFNDCKQNVI